MSSDVWFFIFIISSSILNQGNLGKIHEDTPILDYLKEGVYFTTEVPFFILYIKNSEHLLNDTRENVQMFLLKSITLVCYEI